MRDRLVAGVLCLALVLGLLPAAGLVQPAEAAYWADPYGQQLVEWGVMRGDISGNLNLANPITRAEFVTMCNRAFGYTKLGAMPFTDVISTDWYAEDINIAYNAGYFKGTSAAGNLASPNARLTREQAAVMLARNMLLRETTGESLGFSDSRTLNEWSRGLIGAAVAEGVLTGYSDGSFRPANPITRGEVAAMLVRVIGTPVNKSGSQSMGDVYGNVTINTSNVSLRNTTIVGNLYITGGVNLGNVLLENVTVLGRIVISGGGESDASKDSVTLRNVVAEELVVDSMVDQFVTVLVQGVSDIPLASVRTNAYLNDSSWPGYGLTRIEQDGASLLQLAGSVKEAVNLTPSSDLQLVQGSAERITVDELAKNSQLTLIRGTRVDELNLDVATLVTGDEMGKGDIKNLNVGASGSEIEMLPDNVEIRPGTTATIEGEKMDNVSGAELSTEPHILAGYPSMVNIAPTEAEAQFGGNKPGTIYWAISSLADGSVSEEDLISNPAYGGNIFEEQAGSRDVSAKTIYSEKVEKLTPDGSYYISAIMVDGRGKRSPVKVAAFTTPDDTVPAFVGTPEITKASTTVAQVTATANKNCLLYWALLPKGAAAPTAQQFKTGSVGSNYGYGSLSMVKNAPVSITVNSRRLMEKTEYVLYLWLTDHNGAKSMSAPLALPVITPDETPPIVTGVEQVAPFAKDTADVTYSINEAPATLYWAVVAQGNTTFIALTGDAEEDAALLSDLRTKIKVESGASAGAIAGGSSSVAEAYANAKFTISGLDPKKYGNNFTLYYVGKDAAGNYSEMVGSISIQTLDTTPPSVVDPPQFTSYNGDKTDEPLADTGVKLVFSEQVKGGANASKTFLELYNATIDPGMDKKAHEAAVNAYVEALSSHIRLYQRPRTGNVVLLNDQIKFENAIVTQENDGTVVVFLPGEADVDKNQTVGSQTITEPAINLDSGATYYFQLLGIFDNAFTPNGLSNTGNDNPTGNLTMKDFHTLYAQVNLEWNTRVSKITGASDTALNDIRLDIVVDVKPTSTEKVPDTECWDMIMWSDTTVEIQIYRLVLGPDGEGDVKESWKRLNANAEPITVSQTNPSPGIGLGTRIIEGEIDTKYPVIKTTLKQGYTYRYGIHITKVGTVSEINPNVEADSWSDLVTMHFGLIAGAQGQVRNASINVQSNFDNNFNIIQNPRNISYISTAGTGEVLEASKQFLDTRVPTFGNQWPSFTAGSGTINMKVVLNRPGTVYYVAAPAGVIPTTIPGGATITESNDGSDGSSLAGQSYIPTNGGDRETRKSDIHFMTGGDGGGRGVYAGPDYTDVVAGKFASGQGVYVPKQPITYTNQEVSVDITGLQANTTYYIYTVLQGGGTTDRVVEVYRVKTDPIQTPSISVTPSGTTGVTMTVNNVVSSGAPTRYDNSMLYYALVEWNSLPRYFLDRYDWKEKGGPSNDTTSTGTVMTVLEAMITPFPGGGGMTYFDKFGDEDGINLKDRVMQYISSTTSDVVGYVPTHRYPGTQENPKPEDFTEYMSESVNNTSEYVVLVCARHMYATNDGESYGFSAARGLYKPDMNPPEFLGDTPLSHASTTQAYEDVDGKKPVPGWQLKDDTPLYFFDGTLTIRFDKVVYYYTVDSSGNRVRKEVWNSKTIPADKQDTAISILDVITGTGKSKIDISGVGKEGPTATFDLKFDKLYYGDTIEMGGLCNGDNQSPVSQKTLIMRFDSTLRNSDYEGQYLDRMWDPGFRVTWQ